jgi:hypothetical protein
VGFAHQHIKEDHYHTEYTSFSLENMRAIHSAILQGDSTVVITHYPTKGPQSVPFSYTVDIPRKRVTRVTEPFGHIIEHNLVLGPDFRRFFW